MSGIYIHIPFCKQACFYCDFHFSTNLSDTDSMYKALCQELELKENQNTDLINTIYFGGGTPSIFSDYQLSKIIEKVHQKFDVLPSAEITLEANPDDLSKSKLRQLKSTEVNRLSIGIQTFDDTRLKYINRTHNGAEAKECVENALEIGYENLTADLIYAIPPDDIAYWENDLDTMIGLGLPHVSLYGLTVEEKTVFGNWLAKGKFHETSEEIASKQYLMAIEVLVDAGFNHYEVSSFAKPGFESRHNSSYWSGEKYIGIGPGAHSYDGSKREFNVRNNKAYIKSIAEGIIPETKEILSENQKRNEHILTRLRTSSGLVTELFKQNFEVSLEEDKFEIIKELKGEGYIIFQEGRLALTVSGFMVADEIALRLFYDE